jgi:5'(3')-deoxyribonucleotidase
MEEKLGVDIDGVILNTPDYVLKLFNKKHHTNHSRKEITWNWNRITDNLDEIMNIFKTLNYSKLMPEEPCAPEVFRKLCNNYHVDLITASLGKQEIVESRLEELGFTGYNNYRHMQTLKLENKGMVAKEYCYIIEDSPAQIMHILRAGGKPLMYLQPWNEHLECLMIGRVCGTVIPKWKSIERLLL